jgi:Ni/Co efflux regulator RcnB
MKILMLSAAALVLLAVPAMAQRAGQPDTRDQRRIENRHSGPGPQQQRPQPAQQPQAPQPNREPNRAQFGHDNRPPRGQPDRNRPGHAQTDHRFDQRSDHRSDHRFDRGQRGPDYRRPYNSRSHAHADWSRMRNYHRNYRASRRFHAPSYRRPSGWYYRRWSWGDMLPSLFWSNQYWINDYGLYDLPPPPPGTVWVRYGDDAILIDRYNGEIIQVAYGIFY